MYRELSQNSAAALNYAEYFNIFKLIFFWFTLILLASFLAVANDRSQQQKLCMWRYATHQTLQTQSQIFSRKNGSITTMKALIMRSKTGQIIASVTQDLSGNCLHQGALLL